jgi:hypothetical protein
LKYLIIGRKRSRKKLKRTRRRKKKKKRIWTMKSGPEK